jgi:hypothetical protein
MKKSSRLLASFLLPSLAAALAAIAAPSCGSGEMPSTNNNPGTGNTNGSSGGQIGSNGSGGESFGSSGGATSFGSGGSSSNGSGGITVIVGASGGAAPGSGGAPASGTGGGVIVGGGTGGGAPSMGGALAVVDGYAMNATWKGYGYTFTSPATGSKATVSPATFKGMTQLCAMGMIASDPTSMSVAGMGWNVNQALGSTAITPGAVSGAGLTVSVSASGLTLTVGAGSQLRAQIKGTSGDFCAPIAAQGTSTIPWATFNSKCWDGSGTKFADASITAVELVVPSAPTAIGPFNVCLLDAHP